MQTELMSREYALVFDDLRSDWRIIVAGAAIGLVFGVAAFFMLFAKNEAIAIVERGTVIALGSVGPTLPQNHLVEQLQTPEFAARVAKAVGQPELAVGLASKAYGGNGKLKTRLVSDGTLIEITVTSDSDENALLIAGKVAEFAVAVDQQSVDLSQRFVAERLDLLAREIAQGIKLATDPQVGITKGGSDAASSAAFAMATERYASSTTTLAERKQLLEMAQAPLFSKTPSVFVAPVLVRPLIRTWWLAGLVGVMGGGALGYVLGALLLRTRPASA